LLNDLFSAAKLQPFTIQQPTQNENQAYNL